jgi:hypothetical protein
MDWDRSVARQARVEPDGHTDRVPGDVVRGRDTFAATCGRSRPMASKPQLRVDGAPSVGADEAYLALSM